MLLPFRDDVGEALRRIRRNPRLSLLAAGTLALGIGAATSVFTLAHAVLMAPPPFADPDRIVSLAGLHKGRETGVSGADFLDYQGEAGLFESVTLASYAEFSWTGQSLPGFDGAEVLRGLVVTADYFKVFELPMAAGRGFLPGEDQPGPAAATVISHSLWQRRFGGRHDVIGHTITLNGEPRVVVGVAGPKFLAYQSYEVVAWVPFRPSAEWRDSRQYSCFARLARDLTMEGAGRRLDAVASRLAAAFPSTNGGYTVRIEPLLTELRDQTRPALLALAGAVICLLLVASANVAALLLARATSEVREMTIRTALGAGRLRLLRMVLAQSILLALFAGVGGAVAGAWLLAGMRALVPPSVQFDWAFVIDARVFVAAFLVASVAGLAAGVAPAFETFRLAGGGLRPTLRRSRLLRTIVTAEIALAVFLSVGSGLLGRSFVGLLNRPLGYQTENLLGMRVRLTGERYRGTEKKATYWVQLVERVGALPGVAMAASVSDLPMGWQYIGTRFEVDRLAGQADEDRPRTHTLAASPGYFATVGIPVLAGRVFDESDGPDAEPVAVVNDLVAERYWPGESAIGHRVRFSGERWLRVVGVVRRVRHGGPADEWENQIYMPFRQFNINTMFLVVRLRTTPETIVPSIRAALESIDPEVPAFEIRTMERAFAREIAQPRLPVVLTIVFAGLAILLAGLGLFGVVAYWVSRRTKEFAIRNTLGARPGVLRSMVLGQGARLMGVGVAVGLAGAFAAMRLLRSLLYGMSERDPAVYLGAAALAILVTTAACWVPAVRASRTDPAVALRDDG